MADSDADSHLERPSDERRGMTSWYSSGVALAGIVAGLATLNCAVFWLSANSTPLDYLEAMFIGSWVIQPILFGVWAALGPGRFVTRLPVVVPCLLLVIVAPGLLPRGFADVEGYEFITFCVVGMAILLATAGLLAIFRWYAGWRIVAHGNFLWPGPRRVQFDVKYLLALITLYGLAIGLASSLNFSPGEPSNFFGPEFVVYIIAVGGALISATILPVIAAPLFILSRRRSLRFARRSLAFWAIVTAVMTVIWALLEGVIDVTQMAMALVLVQLGALIVATAAGVALRLAGYQFVTHHSVNA